MRSVFSSRRSSARRCSRARSSRSRFWASESWVWSSETSTFGSAPFTCCGAEVKRSTGTSGGSLGSSYGSVVGEASSDCSVRRFWSCARRPVPKPPSVCSASCGFVSPSFASSFLSPRGMDNFLAEEFLDVEDRRPEDDEEHRREDEEDGREEHLDRGLHRSLLGRCLAPQPCVRGLDAKNPAERRTELIGLNQRAGERRELLCVHALGKALERLRTALADAHLRQSQAELLGERPFHVLVDLGQRRIEAESGLDADREQVERVG